MQRARGAEHDARESMDQTEFFLTFLREEGFRPELTEYGNVLFRFEGGNYLLMIHEDDQQYYQLFYSNFWRIDSAEELQRALLYANEVCRWIKVAKVYVNEEQTNVSAAVEMYIGELDAIRPCFMRTLTTLQGAINRFREHMRRSAREYAAAANEELVRRWFREVLTFGELDVIDEIIAADHVYHDLHSPPDGWGAGPQGARRAATSYRSAFTDLRCSVRRQLADETTVVTHWSATGRHTNAMGGISPTGADITITGMTLQRVVDGRITETRSYDDMVQRVYELRKRLAAPAQPEG